jgi:prepilin-type processing-associated H-X9-DG protein
MTLFVPAPMPATAGTQPSKVSTVAHVTAGPYGQLLESGEIYSFHSGVANVCMGDGSVRTIKSTISLRNLLVMAARQDGAVSNE